MTLRSTLIATLALAIGLATHASDFKGLKEEMNAVADKVSRTLTEEGHSKVAIRDFTAPAALQANFGNALKDELACALKEKKVDVDALAKYEIGGEYRIAKDAEPDQAKNSNLFGLLIQFEIKEQDSGKSLGKFAHQVFDNSLMSSVGGLNGSAKPNDTLEDRNKTFHDKLKNPEFNAANSQVVVDKFGMELGILAGEKFTPRAVTVKNKVPFVELNHNEQYAIRLFNNSDYDVGVLLTVDGLNTFRFSEIRGDKGQSKFSHWIIPARKFVIIKGWHKDFKQVYSFYVTDVPHSAAGQLKSTGSIGVINSQWHAVLEGGQHNATDEGKTRGAELATGKGPEIDAPSKEVAVKMGAMRTSITIRYGK